MNNHQTTGADELGPELVRARIARELHRQRSRDEHGNPLAQREPDIDALCQYHEARCPAGEDAKTIAPYAMTSILRPVAQHLTHHAAYELITQINQAWRTIGYDGAVLLNEGPVAIQVSQQARNLVVEVTAPDYRQVHTFENAA